MPLKKPTQEIKEEIEFFIAGILNYDAQLNQRTGKKITPKWEQNRLKISGAIAQLIEFLPKETHSRTQSEQKLHLRYLLISILRDRLEILIDERPKNSQGKYQGIREWKFTLKFWHPPTQADYISLNLRAFAHHWNQTYNIAPTTAPPRHNLPQRRHTKFIGHRAELERLLSLLAGNRQQIIPIEGMAGVGKTTLALETAYRCLVDSNFQSIIFSSAQSQQFLGTHLTRRFIAERNLRDLLQVIFRTLDGAGDLPSDIEEQILCLQDLLAERPTLIIVDNIENIAEPSDIIGFLACLPPTVKVIIGSRVRLGLGGEAIALEPLDVDESIELIKHQFANQRLGEKQDVKITASQISLIRRIAKGLPLAITYLVGSLSISEEMVPKKSLANTDLALYCFERVVSQLKAIPDAVAYQLLLSLSLFPDGASTEAIAHTIGSDINRDAIAPSLQELYRRTLTFSLTPERYHLHSLTQEYVLRELSQQPELAQTLRDRWLNWYLDFAAPYNTIYWQEWQEDGLLSREWLNLRSVVDWCIQQQDYESVVHFWQCLKGFTLLNGYWQDRQQWLSWLESAAQEREDLAIVAELKYHNSYTLAFIDESDASAKAISLALEAWEMQEHLKVEVQFDLAMYIAALYIRQHPKNGDLAANLELAQSWIDRGKQILATIPNAPYRQFQIYYYQAEIQCVTGELAPAYDCYLLANQIAEQSGLKRPFYFSSVRMAAILMQQKQFVEAETRLVNGLNCTREYKDSRGMLFCLKYLAEVKKAQKDAIAARELGEEAKNGFKKLRMKREEEMMEQFLQQLR
ncbi:NB-ARC domain-containing protein [Merismopedia glauca]|uniref:Uncharacterized protein n=1 Tax=Merismopedia glauca CCAP 1448/3 TaxID=1296344 RepID=A0A2T1C0S1_9CYAN|nr:NB-ARC domain-containing protein [Merismopedia glauca]PSB01860.1 hypothetical protein C7B64_16140 [Merismopedia glauca CCAP 1448/3]